MNTKNIKVPTWVTETLDLLIIAFFILFPTLLLNDKSNADGSLAMSIQSALHLTNDWVTIPFIKVPVEVIFSILHTVYAICYWLLVPASIVLLFMVHLGITTDSIDIKLTEPAAVASFNLIRSKLENKIRRVLIICKDCVFVLLAWDHGWYKLAIAWILGFIFTFLFERSLHKLLAKCERLLAEAAVAVDSDSDTIEKVEID
jgi:hypothetical protein